MNRDADITGVELQVLTVAQVSMLMRCATTTVEEKARSGELPGLKFGVSWVFPMHALMKAINDLAESRARIVGNETKYDWGNSAPAVSAPAPLTDARGHWLIPRGDSLPVPLGPYTAVEQ